MALGRQTLGVVIVLELVWQVVPSRFAGCGEVSGRVEVSTSAMWLEVGCSSRFKGRLIGAKRVKQMFMTKISGSSRKVQ